MFVLIQNLLLQPISRLGSPKQEYSLQHKMFIDFDRLDEWIPEPSFSQEVEL